MGQIDSDGCESADDEDDMLRILSTKQNKCEYVTALEEKEMRCGSNKIDLNSYKPKKSVEYNVKVVRGMIRLAKKATNTDRAKSIASNRRDELKISKFFKTDPKNFKMSKIAREADEAMHYLDKRQPLVVQNTKDPDDDVLFSVPDNQRNEQRIDRAKV